MIVKLKYFDQWQARRQKIAQYYLDNLNNIELPSVKDRVTHSWHKFVVHHAYRDELRAFLKEQGIETKIHYKGTLFLSKLESQATANTETCLSLPIYPELTDGEVERVVCAVNQYTSR